MHSLFMLPDISAKGRDRTPDLLTPKSQLLYQLSYFRNGGSDGI